jgi:CHAT domain-containing protein
MRAARELYRHLLAPAESMLRTGDTLIIVPDGALASIPFEALLTNDNGTKTDNPQFNSLPYLFRNHPVRYGWSATSLQEMSRPKLPYPDNCRGAHDFLGVAAFNEDSWTVKGKPKEILKWSGHTVSDILSLFGNRGDFLGAGGAQKSIFLQKAPCARFLHLSTHAKADDRDTYIAFAPNGEGKESELLTLEDIYNSSLPRAEVVTLGACETGSGKLGKGEGYLSIGRAFAYAGAKSIVFTLWEVKETSSREVLGNFYEELIGKGKSKTEALTAAKRRMLGNWSLEKLKEKYSHPSSNPITNSYVEDWAHPYFWSGFVLAGDGGEVSR